MKRRIQKKRAKDANEHFLYMAKVVNFDTPERTAHAAKMGHQYPFKDDDVVLVLGEIERMPGHVAVVTQDGRVHFAWHSENFQRLSQEDL